MNIWKQFFRMWAVMGAYIAALFLLLIIQGTLDATELWPMRRSAIPFVVLHLILLAIFFVIVRRTFSLRVYREAQLQGKLATAQVLAVRKTGWRNWSNHSSSLTIKYSPNNQALRVRQYEYELLLRVVPPDAAPYETKVTGFMQTGDIPPIDSAIAVKIHPQRPDIVVLAER